MNNRDIEMQACLEKGPLRIGEHYGILNAVLETSTGNIRVSSDKGAEHLFLQLIGKVLDRPEYSEMAEKLYPRPLGPLSQTEFDRLFLNHYTKIHLVGNVVCIDRYSTNMPFLHSIPGKYIQRGGGLVFSVAMEDLKIAPLTIDPDRP